MSSAKHRFQTRFRFYAARCSAAANTIAECRLCLGYWSCCQCQKDVQNTEVKGIAARCWRHSECVCASRAAKQKAFSR